MGVASISVYCWILALFFTFHFFARARCCVEGVGKLSSKKNASCLGADNMGIACCVFF